ncbi:MAG: hypothetical protein A2161_13860 [Candidatus Schekmanbacteria bacterium RBG_13_48_7]|uniref:Uncharacterized protein n=1 Tax=Candidatus Schekmanbacteria bacterium RBG_13_48_7 TaxID=1817878 RepID=A0A1F7S5S5_9BACT|nr:MAG: hypothetical protein A2161_13860 [Candidatus Schekmanbacteria bacterium RBG_13_48_7]
MRQQVPLFLTFFCGILLFIQYFIPHPPFPKIYEESLNWMIIIGIFTLFMGIISMMKLHYTHIKKHDEGWPFSIVAIVSFLFMVIVGVLPFDVSIGNTPVFGIEDQNNFFNKGYEYVLQPIQATMFALLAFYIASAAYRAFRARSLAATILLVTSMIVMLGRVPIGEKISAALFFWIPLLPNLNDVQASQILPHLSAWLLNVPNMGAKRAIHIGVGMGAAVTAVKIIVGIERPYMGGGK